MILTPFQRGRPSKIQPRHRVASSYIKSYSLSPLKFRIQIQKTLISVPMSQASREAAQYEWRSKTEFPIVKVAYFCLRESNGEHCFFDVHLENYPIRFGEVRGVALFKMLYLLKEATIGFERLFQRYGPFLITPSMLALNSRGKCKVWLNQDFASNRHRPTQASQKDFLASIFQLLRATANRHKATQLFFQEVQRHTTFCSALAFIDTYAKANKITVPNSCRISQKDIERTKKTCYNASLTMSNPPKFLATFRGSLKPGIKLPLILEQHIPITEREEQYIDELSEKVPISEKTAADLQSRVQSGLQAEDQFLLESLLECPLSSDPLIRSHHQPHSQQSNCFRKLSDQYPSIKEMSSGLAKRYQVRGRWLENPCSSGLEGDVCKVSGNQWEKLLSGLFDGTSELKKSIHEGREHRSIDGHRFQLLDCLGKAVHESEEMQASYQY